MELFHETSLEEGLQMMKGKTGRGVFWVEKRWSILRPCIPIDSGGKLDNCN